LGIDLSSFPGNLLKTDLITNANPKNDNSSRRFYGSLPIKIIISVKHITEFKTYSFGK
jgi:hypothetical protein